jgi:ketosteroid isomerase-like protein
MLLVPALGLVQITNGAEKVTLEDRFRAYIAAVNDGEIEKAVSLFVDDATYMMGTSVFRGKDALRTIFQRDAARNRVLTVTDARADGNTVTATLIARSDYLKARGLDEAHYTAECDFRDGLITQIRLKSTDLERKVRELGLSTLGGQVPVYYSKGYAERAAHLQKLVEDASRYFQRPDILGVVVDLRLVVLHEEDWARFQYRRPPYLNFRRFQGDFW